MLVLLTSDRLVQLVEVCCELLLPRRCWQPLPLLLPVRLLEPVLGPEKVLSLSYLGNFLFSELILSRLFLCLWS